MRILYIAILILFTTAGLAQEKVKVPVVTAEVNSVMVRVSGVITIAGEKQWYDLHYYSDVKGDSIKSDIAKNIVNKWALTQEKMTYADKLKALDVVLKQDLARLEIPDVKVPEATPVKEEEPVKEDDR